MKNKLFVTKPEDRETIITVLARNGYTVRQGREKDQQTGRSVSFVEYWRESE